MNFLLTFIEDIIRNLSGGLGKRVRYVYYRRRLGFCGKRVTIDTGVYFLDPKSIFIGSDTWVDKNCVLIAGKLTKDPHRVRMLKNTVDEDLIGKIRIGNYCHIGIGTIIQGHGGVSIKDFFTSSAGCKLYSLSNDPTRCNEGTLREAFYILNQIIIEENVWLGLNTCVLGNKIEDNAFLETNSVLTSDMPANSVYHGNPAKFRKERFQSRT